MTRKMFINALDPEEVRIAILEGKRLEDFDIETRGVEKNKGNIYKGIVMAVEPGLNAAFVHYGADKQGFLTANDVHPKYAQGGKDRPSGASSNAGRDGDKPNIADLLRPKQTVLVQVSKDEVGSKGAVLTTYLSLAGRYLVLMPDSETQGVSRKIDDEETRKRVREAAAKLLVPDNMGVIIRTAGRDRTRVELNRDLRVLLRLWDSIQKQANSNKAPSLIFKEQDVIIRALRDYFSADIDEVILDSDEAFDRAQEYINLVMPNHRSVLSRYVERRPIFHHYRIEEQIDAIYTPKVTLPSGGSIVIEPTEALVAIDVNSGKQKSGNQEETATETNVEAALEVGRQLKLRDLGGIIVIDFIDMASRKNQQRVERTIKETLSTDKARVKVGHISRNGTLEITRQRIRSALNASVFERCHICSGTGHVLNPDSHAVALLRRLRDRASRGDLLSAKIRVEPEVANLLRTKGWPALQQAERRYSIRIEVIAEQNFRAGQDDFSFETDPKAQVAALTEPDFGPAPRLEMDDEDGEPSPYDDEILDDADLEALEALDREDALRREAERTSSSDEDGSAAVAAPAATTSGRSRRSATPGATGRKKTTRERPAARHTLPQSALRGAKEEDSLAMPTYEWVDPKTLRLPKRGGHALPALEDEGRDGSERTRTPRRRRRRSERGDSQPQAAAASAAKQTEAPKKSFWRRLLGL